MAELSKITELGIWDSEGFFFEREHLAMADGGRTALDWVRGLSQNPPL
jgi:hypothetical protein